MSTVTIKIVYNDDNNDTETHVVKNENGKIFFNGKKLLTDFNKHTCLISKKECQEIYDDYINYGVSPQYACVKAGLHLPSYLDDNDTIIVNEDEDDDDEEELCPLLLEIRDQAVLHLLNLIENLKIKDSTEQFEILVSQDVFNDISTGTQMACTDFEELYIALLKK